MDGVDNVTEERKAIKEHCGTGTVNGCMPITSRRAAVSPSSETPPPPPPPPLAPPSRPLLEAEDRGQSEVGVEQGDSVNS